MSKSFIIFFIGMSLMIISSTIVFIVLLFGSILNYKFAQIDESYLAPLAIIFVVGMILMIITLWYFPKELQNES